MVKLKHSTKETFFWIEGARLLDKTDVILREVNKLDQAERKEFWSRGIPAELLKRPGALPDKNYCREIRNALAAHPGEILDYCRVRQSHETAGSILICLLRQEVSIDDLDKRRNEQGEVSAGELRLDERKYALRIARVSGSVKDPIVHFAIGRANNKHDTDFFIKLGSALTEKRRPPEIDYERIGKVPRFLVDYWCGKKGCYDMWLNHLATAKLGHWRSKNLFVWKKSPHFFVMPPLCFFANSALATFCALALGKKQSDEDTSASAVRKWASRLRLESARTPKIRDIKVAADGLYFVT